LTYISPKIEEQQLVIPETAVERIRRMHQYLTEDEAAALEVTARMYARVARTLDAVILTRTEEETLQFE